MVRKRSLYIFALWMATCSMLLSTILLHHHHDRRVCLVEEKCVEDGNINDEHTEHHENEQEGCSVHQMHRFLINAKVVKSIQKHISDGGYAIVAVLPSVHVYIPNASLVAIGWRKHVVPLSTGAISSRYRRGPPIIS